MRVGPSSSAKSAPDLAYLSEFLSGAAAKAAALFKTTATVSNQLYQNKLNNHKLAKVSLSGILTSIQQNYKSTLQATF